MIWFRALEMLNPEAEAFTAAAVDAFLRDPLSADFGVNTGSGAAASREGSALLEEEWRPNLRESSAGSSHRHPPWAFIQ